MRGLLDLCKPGSSRMSSLPAHQSFFTALEAAKTIVLTIVGPRANAKGKEGHRAGAPYAPAGSHRSDPSVSPITCWVAS